LRTTEAFVKKSCSARLGIGQPCIVREAILLTMQNFSAFVVLSGMLTVLGWSYVTQPAPQANREAYQACIQHHPERYCGTAHLGRR
jgi:hypothetical protein